MENIVGNGKSTSFWNSLLIGSSLNLAFPRLYDLSLQKHGSINDMWNCDDSSWDLRFCRNLTDEEIMDWADHSPIQLPPHRSIAEDYWKWILDTKGSFSSNSLTHKIGSCG